MQLWGLPRWHRGAGLGSSRVTAIDHRLEIARTLTAANKATPKLFAIGAQVCNVEDVPKPHGSAKIASGCAESVVAESVVSGVRTGSKSQDKTTQRAADAEAGKKFAQCVGNVSTRRRGVL